MPPTEPAAVEPVVAALVVDASGRYCPGPVIDAKNAVSQIAVGEVFELITTDPGSLSDIPVWCTNTGNVLLASERGPGGDDGPHRFFIRRGR
ncbi:MAG: sulfurtransferase TusA family protein [Actinomycetota bacterium]|jgi:tRNA 2-thiouridine synthesizing protein A|nr:sulfurtransferase TusA family protein [Actinomycetota bacterium]